MALIFKHDRDDLRSLLMHMLARASVKDFAAKAVILLQEAEVSIGIYRTQSSTAFQNGPTRQSLLKLWKAADKCADKTALLDLLDTAAPGAIQYLERRAAQVWPALDLGPAFENGLLAWAREATGEDLTRMLVRCCAEGREFVRGRDRPSGRQSEGKFEPIVLGIADGASRKSGEASSISLDNIAWAPVPARSKAGRSRIDAKVDLIALLVNDWHRVTETIQTGGRGEDNPLTEFIISVFDWAEIDGVEYALRVYWSELKFRKAKSVDIDSKAKDLKSE